MSKKPDTKSLSKKKKPLRSEAELRELIQDSQKEKIESLRKIMDDLKKFQLSASDVMKFSFKRSDLSSHDEIAKLVEKENISNKGKWIYVFSGNGLPVLLEKFVDRRKKDTKKFSKANDASANSSCIYVGSSNKLATRIKEHLGGLKSNSTYAIRFKEWLPGDEKITCFYFEVKTQNPNPVYNQDFLQNLEDAMWDQLCPIIGKRGGK